ncbi:hypothetical protein COV82_00770 [Candidatus Peregrinibacteria bacterium CG11_big_fil_rev_8_21_14_0_20_46_8]|nr:MAG: hypothetical protein COV82_00770 [Candidatus Peregrinibacteria bacterium CG11_big_fil_rev_8_21_14_0_20_46_8]
MTKQVSSIESSYQKTLDLFHAIERKTGWKENHEVTYKALRAVLHALRDRMIPDEAVQFGSQLPLIVRGMYYEGWKPSKTPQKMSKDEFIQRIQGETYIAQPNPEEMVKHILEGIDEFMAPGTVEKIKNTLPKDFWVL